MDATSAVRVFFVPAFPSAEHPSMLLLSVVMCISIMMLDDMMELL